MIKKHEVERIISDALEELNGKTSESKDEDGTSSSFKAIVEKDENGDLIFLFKEDDINENIDRYRIKIECL